jgi:hypothetical protein
MIALTPYTSSSNAPFEEKVRRLISKGKAKNEALDLVENVDQERSEYIQKYFNLEWPSRQFFHLMVNSEMGMKWPRRSFMPYQSLISRRSEEHIEKAARALGAAWNDVRLPHPVKVTAYCTALYGTRDDRASYDLLAYCSGF